MIKVKDFILIPPVKLTPSYPASVSRLLPKVRTSGSNFLTAFTKSIVRVSHDVYGYAIVTNKGYFIKFYMYIL